MQQTSCQVSNWEEVFGWMILKPWPIKNRSSPHSRRNSRACQRWRIRFLVERGDGYDCGKILCSPSSGAPPNGQASHAITNRKFALKQNITQLICLYGLR